ncbi:hypothetical protein [Novosphingobium sp. B 225]|uniref:hypothetical protein n=1 Tax=Novosphingobium sp. B 225 TaxID=1961849 RepID=UPI000B4B7605|nr:hypothetical protein [Novosphingobium sp. B 225]
MRKILLTATAAAALLGWNASAIANPPAHPTEHGDEHHDGKDEHHEDKGDHHDDKGGDHHDDKDHGDKPKG